MGGNGEKWRKDGGGVSHFAPIFLNHIPPQPSTTPIPCAMSHSPPHFPPLSTPPHVVLVVCHLPHHIAMCLRPNCSTFPGVVLVVLHLPHHVAILLTPLRVQVVHQMSFATFPSA